MRQRGWLWLAIVTTPLWGCTTEDEDQPSADGADAGVSALPDSGSPAADWKPLITGDWALDPGSENTSATYTMVLDRDVYVGAIRPIEPTGTHHTVLGRDGDARIIYASGVGTNAVVFPKGVGLKLEAGASLLLQLHVYNTGESPLSGTSGIEIVEIAADEVVEQADLFLPGPLDFVLPPQQQTVYSGTCTLNASQTIFALFPHMHQLGTHFKMSITKDGVERVVHDKPYDFNEQTFTAFEPITLGQGDKITTECTWVNTLDDPVRWGESSTSEMCFSILYRYPILPGDSCDGPF